MNDMFKKGKNHDAMDILDGLLNYLVLELDSTDDFKETNEYKDKI